jgi:hypothetical protein
MPMSLMSGEEPRADLALTSLAEIRELLPRLPFVFVLTKIAAVNSERDT